MMFLYIHKQRSRLSWKRDICRTHLSLPESQTLMGLRHYDAVKHPQRPQSEYSGSRYAVDVVICIDLFGACCVYQIIIAKTIKQLIEDDSTIDVTSEDLPQLRLYILALLVPVLLLCMIRTLKYLAPFTLIADIFIGKTSESVTSKIILITIIFFWCDQIFFHF